MANFPKKWPLWGMNTVSIMEAEEALWLGCRFRKINHEVGTGTQEKGAISERATFGCEK